MATFDEYLEKRFGTVSQNIRDTVEKEIMSAYADVWRTGENQMLLQTPRFGAWLVYIDLEDDGFKITSIYKHLELDDARLTHQTALIHGFQNCWLPLPAMGPLHRYLHQRLDPGQTYRALLENDTVTAIGRMESNLAQQIPQFYRYLIRHVPNNLWGTPERVRAHIGW